MGGYPLRTRPEVWRLAKFLHGMFVKNDVDWAVADKGGWYDMARAVHNEVYRNASPYIRHEVPWEIGPSSRPPTEIL